MNLQNLFELIVGRVSSERIRDTAERFYVLNRSSNFGDYARSADELSQLLNDAGLDVERLEIPADGKTRFGDAVMPYAWNGRAASLEMVAPEEKPLANLENSPLLLGIWSPPTPEEGVEGELLALTKGEPYELEPQEAKGKFILTPSRPDAIRRIAARKEAAAVISYASLAPNNPDACAWLQANSDHPGGWGTRGDETPLIQLSIAPRQGEELARLAAEQETPVRLRMRVDSELSEGGIAALTGLIEGVDPASEVWLYAPLYGPGANYHAVAAAALAEAARVLKQGIDDGSMPKPVRSIRFLFLPKPYGALAYAHLRPEAAARALYAFCLESGAGNPDLSWCRWDLRLPPAPLRHFVDALVARLCREYLKNWRPQRPLEIRPFALHADVSFIDPAIDVPVGWLHGGTDSETRHTSADTLDTLDNRSCVDLASFPASAVYAAACIGVADIPLLSAWNAALAQERLQDDLAFFIDRVNEAGSASDLHDIHRESRSHLRARVKSESQTLRGLSEIGEGAMESEEWDVVHELRSALRALGDSYFAVLRTHLDARAAQMGLVYEPKPRRALDDGDARVPRRIGDAKGLITLDALPFKQWTSPVRRSPRASIPFILAWWLIDGKRTVSQIDRLVRLEAPRFRECIPAWFTFLKQHGYIEIDAITKEEDDEQTAKLSLASTSVE